jgi:two-component system sensor histidine kinase HydH
VDDSRVQSALLGWIIALAITVSVLLRRDKDLRQKLFVLLGGNVTLYYFFSLACAVLLPLGGLYFFRAFSAVSRGKLRLGRLAIALAGGLIVLVVHPTWLRPAVGPAVLAYVVGFMLVAILDLNVQARTAPTRVDAARIRYLFGGGLIALSLQVVERGGHMLTLDFPPVGLATTLLYLYIISQTIVRYRILDLYEMLGRFAVLTLMGAALAGIYTALVFWPGRGFAINAFLASLVILLLFDPLRDLVERKIADFFFGERRELEQQVAELRRQLAHIINIGVLADVLLGGLEDSRRVTHAALYLIDPHGRGFDLRSNVGPEPAEQRVEVAEARRRLQPFATRGAIVRSTLTARRERQLRDGDTEQAALLAEALELLDGIAADVLLEIRGEDSTQLLGLLAVRDERRRDAFSPEEVSLLSGLAGQVAVTVENSRLYQQMKERDRLAALGQMSAGLAHEIRNPLGAIKAAAQFIEDVGPTSGDPNAPPGEEQEFLTVIVEEVDRLNRVVSDFLTYARPASGSPKKLDVNDILKRTLQVFETGRGEQNPIDLVVELVEDLPGVVIDGERLHQVFLNLIINASQAMDGQTAPRLEISTRLRRVRRMRPREGEIEPAHYVEVRFNDHGPGIPPEILEKIFIPFFTSKEKGSGIGLSICQRIIRDAGGEIEVRSQVGQGTIFTVVLPATVEQPDEREEAPA